MKRRLRNHTTIQRHFSNARHNIKHGDIVLSGDERIFDYDFE